MLSSVFLQRNSFSIDLFFSWGYQNCQFWISNQITQILRASNADPVAIVLILCAFFPLLLIMNIIIIIV